MGNQRKVQRPQGGSRVNVGYVIVGAILVAFLAGFVALVVWDSSQRSAGGAPGAVENVDVGAAGQHTTGQVDYEQTPPAGGEHSPIWQNEGFYTEPIGDENAVHTLEHGGVWITYQPDLPQEQVQQIQSAVEGRTCMIASPYEGLPSPVVASAWGKQLQLDSADDPALDQFIQTYLQGPQTPEPGAACTGGTGSPA